MKNVLILLMAVLYILTGCQSEQNGDHKKTDAVHQGEQEQHHDHHEAEEAGQQLRLNDGQKWKANPETTTGIRQMQQTISNFVAENPDSDAEALGLLAADLKTIFNEIIQQCTMKGEPHDQLHLYLMPLLSQIKGFEEGGKTFDDVAELQAYLKEYFEYFE